MLNHDKQLELLMSQYKKQTLNRKETAEAIGISISTLDTRVRNNSETPRYIKLGNGKKARVLFPTIEVAKFLVNQLIKIS